MRLLNEDIMRELKLKLNEEKSLKNKVILKKIIELVKELD